jgi:RNA polymerase sigma factor (sigma-70 family)
VNYAAISAEDLARLCAESADSAAWEEFVSRFHRLIATVVLRRAARWGESSPAVLDDIIQEVYLKLCRDNCRLLREFRPVHPDAIFGYLKVVAANTANDHFKAAHTASRGRDYLPVDLETAESAAEPPDLNALSAVEREILIGEIDACLRRCLPAPNRERDCSVFWLHYRAGMTTSAIAEMPAIALTAKGVESIIHRLTRLLRMELGQKWSPGRKAKGFFRKWSLFRYRGTELPRPGDEHLSEDEIERLAGLHPEENPAAPGDARRHIESCEACRGRLLLAENQKRMLSQLQSRAAAAQPGCPPRDTMMRLIGGILAPAAAEEILRHAGTCDYCCRMLRECRKDFADEPLPGEEQLLRSLRSAQPDFQRRLAMDLARSVRPQPRQSWWARLWPAPVPRWAYAVATVPMVFVAVLAAWLYHGHQNSPERLLAAAYSQRRSFEMRFAGADYGPLKQERGAAPSRFDRPPALLEAEAVIARNLVSHPDSVEWLAARARAELLDWHYDAAIQSLKRALLSQPDSPSLLIDLASAYFQRAEALDRAIDYGTAIELLGKALAARPNDPIALFNRAIAYERMFLPLQAIADWEQYLRVDPNGAWAAEARQRLAALREKVRRHDAGNKPVASPAEIDFQTADARIEDYLDAALQRWLPLAFPENVAQAGDAAALRALSGLSSLLAGKHGDTWLSDLLQTRRSPAFASAVSHLSRTLNLNAEGKPSEAEQESSIAEQLFVSAGSTPGALRARLETTYARQRAIQADRCLETATALHHDLGQKPYAWIRVQLSLELGVCRAMLGNYGQAQADVDSALAASRAAGFGTLELRSLGMAAVMDADCGNRLMAWSRDRDGLARYWRGMFPGMRAYQFHSHLEHAAEEIGSYHLALGLAREFVPVIAATPNRSIEAMARFRLGSIARLANATAEAETELARAEKLFASLPQDSATGKYRLRSEINLAQLEIQRGETAAPLQRLTGLRQDVGRMGDLPWALAYHATLGGLYRRRGDAQEAQNAFHSALALIEQERRSLSSARDRDLWMRQSGDAYRALVAMRLQGSADPGELLEFWESYRSERPQPQRAGWLRAASRSLTSETVLSYAQSRDGLAIWVTDDAGVSVRWVALPSSSLDRLARQFSQRCAAAGTSLAAIRRDGNQLYRWLIQPVEARLKAGRTLVIEPDGAIADIPLQALVDNAGVYLAERYPMVWSPGVWLESAGSAGQTPPVWQRALVIGAPAIEGDAAVAFPPLPDALREARQVAARFERARLFTGSQATLDAVDRELPAADVFHFAGHGFSNASGGGLILTSEQGRREPAVLNPTRFAAGQLSHCRLAVLSACSTGTGQSDELVDPESLARSFLRAGVSAVIAARWRIDSAGTAALIDRFYEALLRGQPAAQALRAAALDLHKRPQSEHPYFWAAFSMFGSGRAPS